MHYLGGEGTFFLGYRHFHWGWFRFKSLPTLRSAVRWAPEFTLDVSGWLHWSRAPLRLLAKTHVFWRFTGGELAPFTTDRIIVLLLLLMEEILHQLGCIEPGNIMGTATNPNRLAGFLPSTARPPFFWTDGNAFSLGQTVFAISAPRGSTRTRSPYESFSPGATDDVKTEETRDWCFWNAESCEVPVKMNGTWSHAWTATLHLYFLDSLQHVDSSHRPKSTK